MVEIHLAIKSTSDICRFPHTPKKLFWWNEHSYVGIAFVQENKPRNMTCTGKLLTGYFPEALVLTCSSLLVQKCGVCRPVSFPLLNLIWRLGMNNIYSLNLKLSKIQQGHSSSHPLTALAPVVMGSRALLTWWSVWRKRNRNVQGNHFIPPAPLVCAEGCVWAHVNLGPITWIETMAVPVCCWKEAIPPFAFP